MTEDGYILALYRINSKSGTDQRKEPVLLDHGLMSSSESWIFAGPKKAMAYLLADANYDVWLANSRGSMHSRKHERFNPDRDNKYWAFRFEIFRVQILRFIDLISVGTKLACTIYRRISISS